MEKSRRETHFYEGGRVKACPLEMCMKLAERKKIQKLVVRQIAELENQLALSRESSQTVELDQTLTGRVSRIDAIQQQKMALSSLSRDKKLLIELENTLEKLSNDDFGKCEECEQDIPIARLEIKPESKFCIACQEMLE